jgi:hypothetical protein
VRLSADAKEVWKAYYNAHGMEQADLTGDLSAAWSKLEEYAARLALIFHFIRWAANDPTLADVDRVDVDSMNAAIRLTQWFKHEARRVYAMLDESDGDRDLRRLEEWIARKGGLVTIREVQQGCRWLREPGKAEAALEELVKRERGAWEPSRDGERGQPTRRFRLSTPSTVYGNANLPERNGNTVDVDTVDTTPAEPPVKDKPAGPPWDSSSDGPYSERF